MWKCGNCAAVLDDEYFECYICGKPLDQGDLIIDEMYEQSTTPRNMCMGISLLFGFNLLIGGLAIPVLVASIFAVFGFMGEPTLMEQSLGSFGFVSYMGMWWVINSLIIRRWLVKRELYWLLVFIFLAFGILTVWLFWG